MIENEKIIGENIKEPKSVLLETNEWIKDERMLFQEKILEKYIITNSVDDYIVKDCGINFSSVKIGRLLSNLINVVPRDINIKNIKCRTGIREI